jgi:hypothetical protein
MKLDQKMVPARDGLPLCDLADEPLALLAVERRTACPAAFGVGDDLRLAALEHGDDRVGRAEVDPDHLAHFLNGLLIRSLICRAGQRRPTVG